MKCCDDFLIIDSSTDKNCDNACNCFGSVKTIIPAALGDDSADSEAKPVNGAFSNKIVEYEANGAVYIYDRDGFYTKIKDGA